MGLCCGGCSTSPQLAITRGVGLLHEQFKKVDLQPLVQLQFTKAVGVEALTRKSNLAMSSMDKDSHSCWPTSRDLVATAFNGILGEIHLRVCKACSTQGLDVCRIQMH